MVHDRRVDAEVTSITRANRRAPIARVITRRLTFMLPILVIVSMGVFALAALSPLDPLDAYLNGQSASLTPDQREQMRAHLGLDQPWWGTWWSWASGTLHGDFGQSLVYRQSVSQVFLERLPWTLLLGAAGVGVGVLASMVMGVAAALRPGSALDRGISMIATLLQALPPFVIGMGVIAVFAVTLHLSPTGGLTRPGEPITPGGVLSHLALPTIVLALSQMPWLILGLRQTLRDTLRDDAITFARLRGIRRITVILRHLLPLALPPFIALVAMRLPELVAGSAIVEAVFAWPGLGSAIVQAAQRLDLALLATLTLATTALVLTSTLIADVLYVRLDPRVDGDV